LTFEKIGYIFPIGRWGGEDNFAGKEIISGLKETLLELFLQDFRAFITAPAEEEKSILTAAARYLAA
jgi:hypothetical protein